MRTLIILVPDFCPRFLVPLRLTSGRSRLAKGTGESVPMSDASAQAVIAPQSFHWMASAATLREVHRVLVPGGAFILVWNILDKAKPWIR